MAQKNITSYQKAFYRVLDYIDTHLYENLDLEKLSQVAVFSKYHFHRQFTGFFGISIFKYIQLVRLKRASYQLAFRKNIKIMVLKITNLFPVHLRRISDKHLQNSEISQSGSLGTINIIY